MDNATARVLGGIYIALCSALSDEGARLAHDVLFGLADSPAIQPDDARVYRAIAESASRDIDEIRADNEQTPKRPRLELVSGGAA